LTLTTVPCFDSQLVRAQHQRDTMRLKDLEARLNEEQELKVGYGIGVFDAYVLPPAPSMKLMEAGLC